MEPVSTINATASTIGAGKAVFKAIRAILHWAEPDPPAPKRRRPLTIPQLDYKIEQAADVLANLKAATILAQRKLEKYTNRRKRYADGQSGAKPRGASSRAKEKRGARRR